MPTRAQTERRVTLAAPSVAPAVERSKRAKRTGAGVLPARMSPPVQEAVTGVFAGVVFSAGRDAGVPG